MQRAKRLTKTSKSVSYTHLDVYKRQAYKSTYYSTFDAELSAARTELERFKKECMSEAVAAYRDKYAASEYSSSQKSDDVTCLLYTSRCV